MQYQSTVFAQLLKEVPRGWFERTARQHHSGRQKRALTPWSHLVTMVGVQLAGARSLRDVERVLERHRGVQAHLGLSSPRRSTLADANRNRSAALFEAVAAKLSAGCAGRPSKEALRLIDATRIFAGTPVEAWSPGGIKLHLSLDPQQQRPTWFAVSRARVNDITPAKRQMPVEPGATYVFDKGYYDFGFWAALHDAGCRFVTRPKKNSPLQLIRERKPKGAGIVYDRIVKLSPRLAAQRRNPFQARARTIGVKLDHGGEIALLTNDLRAPAAKIAALYKARWQVELFFKWIKQNLKIDHFLGTSENAITIQIMAALIAYLLIRLACLRQASALSLQAIARLMPTTLFTRRPLAQLFSLPDPPSDLVTQSQLSLAYA